MRSSLDNWSPAELAALDAGVKRAQAYCKQVSPAGVTGDDLYQLAHICSVGLEWNAADTAASLYIKSGEPAQQARAYAIRINALLNLKDNAAATDVARAMLHTVPYDATVDQLMAYIIHFLAMSLDDAALPLAQERQPLLLAALQTGSGLKERSGDTTIGVALLYTEGLEPAYLERYANKDSDAAQTIDALEGALAKVPASQIDNPLEIQRARAQYELLGQPLPKIALLRYTAIPGARAHINPNFGSATVLAIYPDWCAQCVQMSQPLAQFVVRNAGNNIHAYGLLALGKDDAGNPAVADPLKDDRFKPLIHTPTLTTPTATLTTFGATAFPFLVITDGSGIVRFLGNVASNAFDAGGFVEQMIDRAVLRNVTADDAPAQPPKNP